jgi:excinuclease ABC subunit C
MEEVISRRYRRLLEEQLPLPQLIIVDGGKGQLSAAVKILQQLGLKGKVGIIGIAKRLEEIYYPGDSLPMYLDKKSETLKLIQRIRDEAHRFGITHHRSRRTKETVKTELSDVEGIGPVTAEKLLKHFKSVNRIREAKPGEVEKIVGKAKAWKVLGYFNEGTR